MVQNPEFKIKINLGNLTVKVKIIYLVAKITNHCRITYRMCFLLFKILVPCGKKLSVMTSVK